MASTSRLAYANLLTVSGVVITSSADATGYSVQNLADGARWNKWRSSTTNGDQWVKFDLGSNQSFQLLAVTDAVIHAGGTLKAQANATDAWGSPTISDTFTIPSPDFTKVLADWLSATQSLRWIRFYFTNTALVSSYVEIGAAFAGAYISASVAPGVQPKRIDPSQERRATGGQRSAVVRPKYHVISGTLRPQSATARDTWRAANHANGCTEPCVFGLKPGTPGFEFYGVLQPEFAFSHNTDSADLWDIPFTFTEDIQ